jgi:fatty-acyl-CoA synthase
MIKSMNIAWWVKRWSELHPHKTAIIFEGRRTSYLELHEKVNLACCWLQGLGIVKGERVAVMLGNCPEFIELFLACSRMGAIFVPVNYRLAAAELDFTLTDSSPKLFVFGDEFTETVLKLKWDNRRPQILLASIAECSVSGDIMDYRSEVAAFNSQQPFLSDLMSPAVPEEPHVIMYTSGTTGQPKGAVLSHRKTFFNCLNADIFLNFILMILCLSSYPFFIPVAYLFRLRR